jgi:hypothetical protein
MLLEGAVESRRFGIGNEESHVRFRWKTKMVDGFDTTIPLALQWVVGILCMTAFALAVVCSRSNSGRLLLQMWSVLSGLSQQASLQLPGFRLLYPPRCVLVPMRAGPPIADNQIRCGDNRAGKDFAQPRPPSS